MVSGCSVRNWAAAWMRSIRETEGPSSRTFAPSTTRYADWGFSVPRLARRIKYSVVPNRIRPHTSAAVKIMVHTLANWGATRPITGIKP